LHPFLTRRPFRTLNSTVNAWNAPMNTQLGFAQSSPHQRRRGFPTRFRYLTRLAFLTPCYCPSLPFGTRSGAALTISISMVLHSCNKRQRASMAHKVRHYFNHVDISGLHSCNKRDYASTAHIFILYSITLENVGKNQSLKRGASAGDDSEYIRTEWTWYAVSTPSLCIHQQ
jgi:hypothetical protein